MENTVSDSIITSTSNDKDSESSFMDSVATMNGECVKMETVENQNDNDYSQELKKLPIKNWQSATDISQKYDKVIECKNIFVENERPIEILEGKIEMLENSLEIKKIVNSCPTSRNMEEFINAADSTIIPADICQKDPKVINHENVLENSRIPEEKSAISQNLECKRDDVLPIDEKEILPILSGIKIEPKEEEHSKECGKVVQSQRDAEVDCTDSKENVLCTITGMKTEILENKNKNPVNDLLSKIKEETAFSSYCDISIPLIGRDIFQNNEKPLENFYN